MRKERRGLERDKKKMRRRENGGGGWNDLICRLKVFDVHPEFHSGQVSVVQREERIVNNLFEYSSIFEFSSNSFFYFLRKRY